MAAASVAGRSWSADGAEVVASAPSSRRRPLIQHRAILTVPPSDPPKPDPDEIMLRFLRETAHLGSEGQRRVLDTTIRANKQHPAGLEAASPIS